jgi:hypothetical protein
VLPDPLTSLLIDLARFLLVIPLLLLCVALVVVGLGHLVFHREWKRPPPED